MITTAIPSKSRLHAQTYEFAKAVSARFLPRTTAYHEIWLDKKMVAGDAVKDFEPLYGEFYLPRKVRLSHSHILGNICADADTFVFAQFKVAVAVPPNNDVDLFANDCGFIAIVDKDGGLAGFNVTAGGGMGVTHANTKTYPRLGSMLGYVPFDRAIDVAEKILIVQRDNGNREE